MLEKTEYPGVQRQGVVGAERDLGLAAGMGSRWEGNKHALQWSPVQLPT